MISDVSTESKIPVAWTGICTIRNWWSTIADLRTFLSRWTDDDVEALFRVNHEDFGRYR